MFEFYPSILHPEGLDIIITEQPKQVLLGHKLYPNIGLKAAFILQKITIVDGNKRTALVATSFFLKQNGYSLIFNDDEAFKFILAVTNSEDSEKNMQRIGLKYIVKKLINIKCLGRNSIFSPDIKTQQFIIFSEFLCFLFLK